MSQQIQIQTPKLTTEEKIDFIFNTLTKYDKNFTNSSLVQPKSTKKGVKRTTDGTATKKKTLLDFYVEERSKVINDENIEIYNRDIKTFGEKPLTSLNGKPVTGCFECNGNIRKVVKHNSGEGIDYTIYAKTSDNQKIQAVKKSSSGIGREPKVKTYKSDIKSDDKLTILHAKNSPVLDESGKPIPEYVKRTPKSVCQDEIDKIMSLKPSKGLIMNPDGTSTVSSIYTTFIGLYDRCEALAKENKEKCDAERKKSEALITSQVQVQVPIMQSTAPVFVNTMPPPQPLQYIHNPYMTQQPQKFTVPHL